MTDHLGLSVCRRRWTVHGYHYDYDGRGIVSAGPTLRALETVEVMPVKEHEEIVARLSRQLGQTAPGQKLQKVLSS